MKFKPCPKCGRKGLHYADHPHADGFKDSDHVRCRFCQTRFKAERLELPKEAK
jgi:hypothetical protein